MRFVKMHGLGNDYIYLDAITDPSVESHHDLPQLARTVADRHTGIGSDGLILLCPPHPGTDAHLRMRMFNADGSESEMCGNGIRCVCKLAHDDRLTTANPMRIHTGGGILSLAYTLDENHKVDQVTVDMGEPILDLPRIPIRVDALSRYSPETHHAAIEVGPATRETWTGVGVSMGNPHITFFDDDNHQLAGKGLTTLDLEQLGPQIEHHPAFPRRINAHFVRIQSPAEATMRTWERGSGATRACGTGACAVAVAGMLTGRFEREVHLHLPGGDLFIRWDPATNHIFMTGPATEVFRGEWPDAPATASATSPDSQRTRAQTAPHRASTR